MKSLRLGKLQGISLELHYTFVLLILLVVALLALFDLGNLLPTIVLLFFLFLSVFIHEIFHSLVAISKGIRVRKIILLPIGGMAMADEMPEKPVDEFLIAIAGPAFNFAVVIAIMLLVSFFPALPWPWELFDGEMNIEFLNLAILHYPLFGLFWVNLILGVFNLFVPALPMDGGRVLRSLLAIKLGNLRATQIASQISKMLAIFLFLLGLFFNWIIMIIAIFIYFGATVEKEAAIVKETMRGVPIKRLIHTKPRVLDGMLTVEEAYAEMLRTNTLKFPVLVGKRLAYVTLEMLSQIEKAKWKTTKIRGISAPLTAVPATADASKVMMLVLTKNQPFVPVVEKGVFQGLIYEADLQKLYSLKRISDSR